MFVRIWRFAVADSVREEFERAYGPRGDWARLFERASGYVGLELLRGRAGGEPPEQDFYVTIDRWRDRSDWHRFLDEYGEDYRALDLKCEELTLDEAEIGDFVIV